RRHTRHAPIDQPGRLSSSVYLPSRPMIDYQAEENQAPCEKQMYSAATLRPEATGEAIAHSVKVTRGRASQPRNPTLASQKTEVRVPLPWLGRSLIPHSACLRPRKRQKQKAAKKSW